MPVAARNGRRIGLAARIERIHTTWGKAPAEGQCREVRRRSRNRYEPRAGLSTVQIGREQALGIGVCVKVEMPRSSMLSAPARPIRIVHSRSAFQALQSVRIWSDAR